MTRSGSALLVCLSIAAGGSSAAALRRQGFPSLPPPPSVSGRVVSPQAETSTRTGSIFGQVVDANGNRPVAGAVVTLNGPSGTRVVIAEGQGRFVFRDVGRGGFTVKATKPGFVEGAYGRRRPGGSTLDVDVSDGQIVGNVLVPVWRHGAIAGTIRDEHGDPFVGIEVRALLKTYRTGDARWISQMTTTTDDRGAYRLGALQPGDYAVVVPSTNVTVPSGLTVASTAIAGAGGNVVMVSGAYVDGNVVINGTSLTTGIDLAPGRERGLPYAYQTTFYPNALRSSQGTSMTIRSGEEHAGIDFDLSPIRTLTISGTVLNAGVPAAGSVVELLRAAESSSGRLAAISDIRAATGVTDSSGRFTLIGVPPGQFVLRSTRTNGSSVSLWAKMPLTLDADVTDLVVPLAGGFVVSGRLEFDGSIARPSPQRMTMIPISVEGLDPRDGATQVIGSVTADGRFSVNGVPAGDYVVLCLGMPGAWTVKSVTNAGRDVTDRSFEIAGDVDNVVLTFTDQLTEIRGHVAGSTGPDPTASVVVFPVAGSPMTEIAWSNGSRRYQLLRVGKDGSYVVDKLPEGDYYLAALPDEATANWLDAAFLAELAGSATAIHLASGERRALDLRTLPIRR